MKKTVDVHDFIRPISLRKCCHLRSLVCAPLWVGWAEWWGGKVSIVGLWMALLVTHSPWYILCLCPRKLTANVYIARVACLLTSIWGWLMRGTGGRSEDGMKEKSEYLLLLFFPCPAIEMLLVNNYLNALQFNPLNVLKGFPLGFWLLKQWK